MQGGTPKCSVSSNGMPCSQLAGYSWDGTDNLKETGLSQNAIQRMTVQAFDIDIDVF